VDEEKKKKKKVTLEKVASFKVSTAVMFHVEFFLGCGAV
jgi:hypothetical protein